jgi:predicted naringenin-chalcone synthase
MHLQSLASAFPPGSYTQAECWQIIRDSSAAKALRGRSLKLLEKILLGDSGIERRHFCVSDPSQVFSQDAESLNREFEFHAPKLGGEALTKALSRAEIKATDLDAIFVCTCTGYICPGITSHIAEQLGMRPDAYLQDLVGLGCGAAIPTLRSAEGFLSANPDATVAVIAVEVCSAAFYIDDNPGVLISLCLFGDGASASIWRQNPSPAAAGGAIYRASNFKTVHKPDQREKIRFVNAGGKLKNQLHRSVPEVAAEAVSELFSAGPDPDKIDRILTHTGGRDVIDALESRLPVDSLTESREVLRDYGNLSSPSVLIALERHLASENPAENLWLTAFGAGFACHSMELSRESL